MFGKYLCVPEPDTLVNGSAAPEELASVPPTEDKETRKLEIEGQVHSGAVGDEGRGEPQVAGDRRSSTSGSSYDSDGEKNEGSYTSPDYAERYPQDSAPDPVLMSPIAEQSRDHVTPADDVMVQKPEEPIPGETDLDAVTPTEEAKPLVIEETNLDEEPQDDAQTPTQDKADENSNVAPKNPKRKYESSSESEAEDERPEKEPEQPAEDDSAKPEEKGDDKDEMDSKSSHSDDEEKFAALKEEIDEQKPQDEDDANKPGDTLCPS